MPYCDTAKGQTCRIYSERCKAASQKVYRIGNRRFDKRICSDFREWKHHWKRFTDHQMRLGVFF
jgi:hypothetical protein